ncbi:hypothetical protein [Gymnodinialimonas hymeniacidonis]|uniref:hypothetical protein n=1 Tax=Gymnodinialimonas hymeniacidonis TaxID=3126508 RepID=UPI0034C67044
MRYCIPAEGQWPRDCPSCRRLKRFGGWHAVWRERKIVAMGSTTKVNMGDASDEVAENQPVYVPFRAALNLENPRKVPVGLTEMPTRSYFGEEGINRFESAYSRE